MNSEKKKDNVIGIGHNQNEYSKEQYAKLMNATYKILSYAKDMVSNVAVSYTHLTLPTNREV